MNQVDELAEQMTDLDELVEWWDERTEAIELVDAMLDHMDGADDDG